MNKRDKRKNRRKIFTLKVAVPKSEVNKAIQDLRWIKLRMGKNGPEALWELLSESLEYNADEARYEWASMSLGPIDEE